MIANVRRVYLEYLRAIQGEPSAATGRMEILLEVEQRVRLLREIEGTSLFALSKAEILSALETILNATGEREHVAATYDHLEEWRKLRIEASQSDVVASSQLSDLEGTPVLYPGTMPSPLEDRMTPPLERPSGEQSGETGGGHGGEDR